MLVKWIRCAVTDRPGFGMGQLAWRGLRGRPGFLGQCGGWDRDDPTVAHVFGFWSDRFAYQDSMSEAHDELAAAQEGTFAEIVVRTFIGRRELSGGFHPAALSPDAALLRLTYCRVDGGRFGSVIDNYNRMWDPGLAMASGMLGGFLAEEGNSEVLVFSRWRAFADHEAYRTRMLHRVDGPPAPPPMADFAEMARHLVDVEPDWLV